MGRVCGRECHKQGDYFVLAAEKETPGPFCSDWKLHHGVNRCLSARTLRCHWNVRKLRRSANHNQRDCPSPRTRSGDAIYRLLGVHDFRDGGDGGGSLWTLLQIEFSRSSCSISGNRTSARVATRESKYAVSGLYKIFNDCRTDEAGGAGKKTRISAPFWVMASAALAGQRSVQTRFGCGTSSMSESN